MILLLLALCLTLLTALFALSLLPLAAWSGRGLALSLWMGAQIIIIAQVLSELHRLGRAEFFAGHVVCWLIALALWWRQGRPALLPPLPARHNLWAAFRQHPLLSLFAAAMIVLSLLNLAFSWDALPLAGDAYSYHLPRAYFWAEFGTSRFFDTHMVVMNEYPRNPNFDFMWVMLLRGDFSDRGVQITQWVAGWWVALAGIGLVRLTGRGREVALFAGLLILSLPLVIVQMRSIEIDLLTTWVALASLYFALDYLQHRHTPALIYSGIAFGLLIGSKYTVFFWLPAWGLALLIYAGVHLKRAAWRPLMLLALSCSLGFLILGSYSYILNMFMIGNPITSLNRDTSTTGLDQRFREEYYKPFSNFVRYSYMVMDWGMFPLDTPLSNLHQELYASLDQELDLHLETVNRFSLEDYSQGRRRANRVGFGVLGYVLLWVTPAVGVWLAWRARHSDAALLSALYILIGWGWVIFFCLIIAWDPYRMRYFPLVFAPFVVGVLPHLYRWRLPLLVLALLTTADTVWKGFDTAEIQQLRSDYAVEWNILKQTLPAESRIGFVEPPTAYYTIGALPDFHYRILYKDEAEAALQQGQVDVVLEAATLSTGFSSGETVALYLPMSAYNLRVRDPSAYQARFETLYGFTPQPDGRLTANQPAHLLQQRGDVWRVYILDSLLNGEDKQLTLANIPGVSRVVCGGQALETQVKDSTLVIYWDGAARLPYQLFQPCDLYDGSPPTAITLAPDHAPLPDSASELWFDEKRLHYTGFVLTDGYEFPRCGRVPLVTWWELAEPSDQAYQLGIALVNDADEKVSQSDGQLVGNGVFFERRFIPLPCDLLPGLYHLRLGVYDLTTLEDFPITYPDGSPHPRGVHLTSIYVY